MINYFRPYDPIATEKLLKKLEKWRERIPEMDEKQLEQLIGEYNEENNNKEVKKVEIV